MGNGIPKLVTHHLFTWALVENDQGRHVVYPVCPQHPGVRANFVRAIDDQVIITCPGQPEHPLNMCSREEFESERAEAEEHLIE